MNQVHFLHSVSLPLQLRRGLRFAISPLRRRNGCRVVIKEKKMRIAETAAVGLIAVAAQILIAATVLI